MSEVFSRLALRFFQEVFSAAFVFFLPHQLACSLTLHHLFSCTPSVCLCVFSSHWLKLLCAAGLIRQNLNQGPYAHFSPHTHSARNKYTHNHTPSIQVLSDWLNRSVKGYCIDRWIVNVDFLPVECQCHHFLAAYSLATSRLVTNTGREAEGGDREGEEKSEWERQNSVAGSWWMGCNSSSSSGLHDNMPFPHPLCLFLLLIHFSAFVFFLILVEGVSFFPARLLISKTP